ncbi:MAG: hypothetical protein ABI047_02915 [Jatrophihabitantaceae bacterium]
MRVSQVFGLTGSQGTFEFIDVDVEKDTQLFIDPAVLANLHSSWADSCTAAVQSFFQEVLDRIIAGDAKGAKQLMSYLGEENATHLGFSSISRGSGVGDGLAERFYDELSTSTAVATGLVKDLEDTALLIEGVREDRISDVTTNIIRRQLIEFTQDTARYHGIPMQAGVAVGPYWDTASKQWKPETFELPVTAHGPLILVPKAIVRRSLFFNPGQYYRHYVLEFFKYKELNDAKSPLVYLLKSGQRRVNKADVEAKYRKKHRTNVPGIEKRVNVDGTQQNPDLLGEYKTAKLQHPPTPQPHTIISEATATSGPNLEALLAAVINLEAGPENATKYERAIEALLSALLYPDLVNPIRQENIHQGRKRIDISFTNCGEESGFFYWLAMHYPAANILAECKNYGRPLANPEYDQIAGRFSPSRGKVGLLIYREIENKQKVLDSCHDTAADDRGFVIALDDEDLKALVQESKTTGSCSAIGGLLHSRFKDLIA